MKTQFYIHEGNLKIARFFGAFFSMSHISDYDKHTASTLPSHIRYAICYHRDYSKLMPVVEKIEAMGYQFKICRKRVQIWKDVPVLPLMPEVDIKQETKISSIWLACVRFVDKQKQ